MFSLFHSSILTYLGCFVCLNFWYHYRLFYAQFKMPDRDVYIEFVINEDGKNPVESNMENNTVSTVVKAESL